MELVAVYRGQLEAIHLFQLLDRGDRRRVERQLLVEDMQHDPFDQISQGQVKVLGQTFEHLEQAALHAHARLHPLYRYHGNMVHQSRADYGTCLDLSSAICARAASTSSELVCA